MRPLNILWVMGYIVSIMPAVYEYPVALNDGVIYWAMQTGEGRLALARYDLKTRKTKCERFTFNQELLHAYSIERLTLLPEKAGYSFIDNDRLRVKYVHKGSPTSIDFIEPIYQLQQVIWLTTQKGILSAKWHNHFGIFYFTSDGRTEPIIWDGASDYLFPQIVEDILFCVMHTEEKKEYNLCCVNLQAADIFNSDWDVLSFDEKMNILLRKSMQALQSTNQTDLSVMVTHEMPIGFLTMLSTTEGYYCMHSASGSAITYNYYALHKENISWQSRLLFTFTIPKWCVNELCEQIIPFIPRIEKDDIYFSDACNHTDTVGLFSYNKKTGEMKRLLWQDEQIYLPGICYNQVMHYGIRHSSV